MGIPLFRISQIAKIVLAESLFVFRSSSIGPPPSRIRRGAWRKIRSRQILAVLIFYVGKGSVLLGGAVLHDLGKALLGFSVL